MDIDSVNMICSCIEQNTKQLKASNQLEKIKLEILAKTYITEENHNAWLARIKEVEI